MIAPLCLAAALLSAAPAPTTLKALALPGTPAFVKAAKDVIAVRFLLDPSMASGDGLYDDAAVAPSFGPKTVTTLVARLDRDLSALRALPWRSWDADRQVDWRWIYATAEDARRQLAVEKLFTHRAAAWLEPLANDYIALVTYAPERGDVRAKLTAQIPAMVAEMRAVCKRPTTRDVTTADGVVKGLQATLKAEPASAERDAAAAALSAYVDDLKKLKDLPESSTIGAANYEWRLKRALLLPWAPRQLLSLAQHELADVDAAMAELRPKVSTSPAPTDAQRQLAKDLTQEKLLGLYDDIARDDRAFLDKSDLMTIPAGVGPIHARPTPEAMIPLTGDGGSMNPPPTIGDSNVGWWNVEHFKPEWTEAKRLEMIIGAQDQKVTDMGPYAAHEGVPGHHLQLSIARLNPNPIRSLLNDNSFVEGWALYAEWILWQAGGLGPTPEAEYQTLDSWRFRVRRIFYDVHVESGDWSLQDGGDFKSQARRGKGAVDEDVLRTINWPGQLIGYFSGKMQILALKEDFKKKLGASYTDRKFHDALLAEGSIPLALIRAKLLDEPVPGI
jgi:uncharacterized protein (DUF885 family)